MSASVQPTEGTATVQYKLVLAQNRTITFDQSKLSSFDAELKDDVYGNGTGLHTFQTSDPSFVEALRQAMSDANPKLEFRLGFGSPNGMYWLPWQQHLVVRYSAIANGVGNSAGHLVVIVTANSLARMARSARVAAYRGTIADIVNKIAANNNLDTVVQPTDGPFMLYQCLADDAAFIRQRLLPRAISTSGRGGFYCYIRDNVLHFHMPDYQATVSHLDYYGSFGTQVETQDRSEDALLWDAGVAGARVISYDPLTGKTRGVPSDPDSALRLADTLYQFQNVANGQRNIPQHRSFNPPVEDAALAQSAYQWARQRIFVCDIHLEKTISIRHGDLLNLSLVQQVTKASSYSGYYFVTSATHIVKKSAVHSVYTLSRGELRGQDQSLSTQSAQQLLLPASKAPGVFPNLLETQSSELTKGAGNYSSAKTYTTLADANTGNPAA